MLALHHLLGAAAVALFAAVAASADSPKAADAPAADPKDVKAAADGVTAFAGDLYAQLRAEKGNLIVSPYSISAAVGMTAAGAEGDTLDQMRQTLHLPAADKIPGGVGGLMAAVAEPPKNARSKPELNVANAIWAQQGYPWKKEYVDRANAGFKAGVRDLDFRADPEAARAVINRWVEDQTKERIKDLVPPRAIDQGTKMVLTNAIYFKARWLETFNKANTKPAEFTKSDGSKVRTPLMYQKDKFALAETDALQVLRMPYDGGTTAMYVILPRKADALADVEKQLTGETLAKWTAPGERVEDVKVWFPKFKFTRPTELADTLAKMGMADAFSPQKANFKGMTDNPEGLFISRVIHKAFVEVDEVGTEAAAATAVVLAPASAPRPVQPPPPKEFKADHPFLFVIKHEPTGAVLFLGRVEDPTKE